MTIKMGISNSSSGKWTSPNTLRISNSSHSQISTRSSVSEIITNPNQTDTPADLLTKALVQRTLEEDGLKGGISIDVFVRCLFPNYPELGVRLFRYFAGKCNVVSITQARFRAQIEKLLGVIPEEQQKLIYLNVFGVGGYMDPKEFQDLLILIYKIAMNHYPEGPQSCRLLFKTIHAVVESCFHAKVGLTVGSIKDWLEMHCPRIIDLLHRYVVHILSTSHRRVEDEDGEVGSLPRVRKPSSSDLELSTPILEKELGTVWDLAQPLLPVSQVWILSSTLPALYTRPSQSTTRTATPDRLIGSSPSYIGKFVHPTRWTLLYNSTRHGLGVNRFMHHVMRRWGPPKIIFDSGFLHQVSSYKGPTLTFFRSDENVELCVGSTQEWHESHLCWGDDECIVVQLLPRYRVVHRGSKIMYLNFTLRGYPHGIRVGDDPKNPAVSVDEGFAYLTWLGCPYRLFSVEVWGCGSTKNREMQLDTHKWRGKEAGKKVTSSEWGNHPDRYLLELAGRSVYSGSSAN